ncbi:MAG: trypsin-like peptidase domain-containing protein [Candidatus Coatesbacteria bacterium]|nr:trypsin-like peptidase domain-containing protein [Candidatus Coatesbacteria bacterium]
MMRIEGLIKSLSHELCRLSGWTALAAVVLLIAVSLPSAEPTSPRSARETPVVLAVRAAQDAVVNISTERIVERSYLFGDEMFERLFRQAPLRLTEKETSLGSGVVIDDNNHVLTNAHVVRKASRISIKTSDGNVYLGKLVGWDVKSDIAVLKIESEKPLPHAKIGTAKDLMIAETVIAIGNPYGYSHTVTTGVVSALKRDIEVGEAQHEVLYDLIQTDAAINPGNSGGPLINLAGEVIGINTAILDAAEGMGFATPIDRAMRVVEDLISFGEVHIPWLGIDTETMELPRMRSVSSPDQGVAVVVVVFVFSKGPASGSIQTGDLIERIGDAPVHSEREFRARLKDYKATDVVPLSINRDGASARVEVQAREFPAELARLLCYEWLGFWVEEVNPRGKQPSSSERPLVIVAKVRTKSPADKAGLREKDILTQINDKTTETLSDFNSAILAASGRGGIYVEIRRGGLYLRGTIP